MTKIIETWLSPEWAEEALRHELRNTGSSLIVLAPWALTMLRLGGTVILPQPDDRPD